MHKSDCLIPFIVLCCTAAFAQNTITVEDFTTRNVFTEKEVSGINWMNDGKTERYLQTPQLNPGGYDLNSPATFAERLEGKFCLCTARAMITSISRIQQCFRTR